MNTININTNSSASFKGYDARPLKGIIMNSNYAHIADEMREIGEIEKFKIFLFQQTDNHINLVSDNFKPSNSTRGCWLQDAFGIVKNSLLSCENCEKKHILQKLFHLEHNRIEHEAQDILELDKQQAIVDYMYNLPQINTPKGKMVLFKEGNKKTSIPIEEYKEGFKQEINLLNYITNQTHIKGGNYFIVKGENGKDEVLIGQNDLKKYSIDELKEMFKAEKIHPIPQADYHLDLFIRPLTNKKVLVADDNLMYKILTEGFDKLTDYTQSLLPSERKQSLKAFKNLWDYINNFPKIISENKYARMEEVQSALISAGFEPIAVPARLYQTILEKFTKGIRCILKHDLNYLNAQALINPEGKLIYITNKSNIDKHFGLTPELIESSGFSVENEVLKTIKPHVDKIYEVGGDNNAIGKELLPKLYGGIHCMGAEVPI